MHLHRMMYMCGTYNSVLRSMREKEKNPDPEGGGVRGTVQDPSSKFNTKESTTDRGDRGNRGKRSVVS